MTVARLGVGRLEILGAKIKGGREEINGGSEKNGFIFTSLAMN